MSMPVNPESDIQESQIFIANSKFQIPNQQFVSIFKVLSIFFLNLSKYDDSRFLLKVQVIILILLS